MKEKVKKKHEKQFFLFNHLSQIITDNQKRKIVRKLVGKLNIISKFFHTY